MYLIPTVIEKENSGERSYDIYSRLLKDRIILLNGEIDDNLSNSIVAQLLYLDSISNSDISLYINSPGGSITSGMAIYDTMNFIKSDVSTICIGMAASMALGGASGQATEIKIAAERILKLKDKINKILSENTGKDIKKIENDTERDNFMSSYEALQYGIIDKIITSK